MPAVAALSSAFEISLARRRQKAIHLTMAGDAYGLLYPRFAVSQII